MSPELKTPLQLREIEAQPQHNHQPQVKLLFSSPSARRLSAPTRAFTRASCLASQQQPCSSSQLHSPGVLQRFSHSSWHTQPCCPATAPGGKTPLPRCASHPTSTSTSPGTGFAEFTKCLFSGCFPLGGKASSGEGGKGAGPHPIAVTLLPALAQPGFAPDRGGHTQSPPGHGTELGLQWPCRSSASPATAWDTQTLQHTGWHLPH